MESPGIKTIIQVLFLIVAIGQPSQGYDNLYELHNGTSIPLFPPLQTISFCVSALFLFGCKIVPVFSSLSILICINYFLSVPLTLCSQTMTPFDCTSWKESFSSVYSCPKVHQLCELTRRAPVSVFLWPS